MSPHEPDEDPVTLVSDQLLLKRIKEGDKASFETLFYRHYDRVYGLLFRLLGNRAEAEDVLQEVFLKLYQKPLGGRREHNVSAWLYRVATNMGYNYLRGRNRRWGRNRLLAADPTDSPVGPDEVAAQQETRKKAQAALAQLSPRQAELLLLRQMDFTYAELAETFNVAPGSIGTMLARAADAFRTAYNGNQDGGEPA